MRTSGPTVLMHGHNNIRRPSLVFINALAVGKTDKSGLHVVVVVGKDVVAGELQ